MLDRHSARCRPGARAGRIAKTAARATALLALLAGGSAAAAESAGAATWTVAQPPFTTPLGDNVPFAPLYGISAISTKDVWAVGEVSGTPLTDDWNGTRWSRVALPSGPCSVFENDCVLTGVSGDSASDVVAVGNAIINSDSAAGWIAEPIAFHWNGKAWAPMPVPAGASDDAFEHVQAFSPTDAWAVGVGDTATGATVAAEQWNGAAWTTVDTGFSTTNNLDVAAISGSSSTDVWVVGETTTSGYTNRQFTSVALHYNGSNWSQIPVPDGSGLVDVFSLSPSSAWAVAADGSILSWNGSAWTVLTQLSGAKLVAALSPTDVWVEGVVAIAHYNGSSWTTAPVPAGFDTPTGGGASLTPGHVWFAGAAYLSNGDEVPAVLNTTNG